MEYFWQNIWLIDFNMNDYKQSAPQPPSPSISWVLTLFCIETSV